MRKVIILKSESDSSENYTTLLEENNFNAQFIPTLDFHFKNLDKLESLLSVPSGKYAGIIFTSPRSIDAAEEALKGALLPDEWKELDNYCVGPASFNRIKSYLGLEAKGKESGHASGLADYIKEDLRDKIVTYPFLFPCGNLQQDILQNKLADYGYNLEAIEVYETVAHGDLEENLKTAFNEPVEFLVFFSPSGVNCTMELLKKNDIDISKIKLVAIGPSTRKGMEALGLHVHKTSAKPTTEFLVKALLES